MVPIYLLTINPTRKFIRNGKQRVPYGATFKSKLGGTLINLGLKHYPILMDRYLKRVTILGYSY